MQNKTKTEESPVLLVCIYNQYGNIITHDHLYQLFSPFGEIIKILIFQKAKVWKTFVQYDEVKAADEAMKSLNNKLIFEDGSKMNIFKSKLKHIQLQNNNLGGVNYEHLKQQGSQEDSPQQIRPRRSTFQDYISSQFEEKSAFQSFYSTCSKNEFSSTSGHMKSDSLSPEKSHNNSFNNLYDIDEQFRELALESQVFRTWEEKAEENRKKSKTIVNPNSQQFLIENCPSKVLFVRSIPQYFDNVCIYNIFSNFGKITKVIYIKQKNSALIQFEQQIYAIHAKDQINYAKPEFKVFYSHYENLILKKINADQEEFEYKSQSQYHQKSNNFNPPSEVLFITMITPKQENQIRSLCQEYNCPVKQMQWKQNMKDKWMCLVEFFTLRESLFIMGKLQGCLLSNGRKLRLAFTRSKIRKGEFKLHKVEHNKYHNEVYGNIVQNRQQKQSII